MFRQRRCSAVTAELARVARGIKAVEAGAHIDAVVGAALSGRAGAWTVAGGRIEWRSRRRLSLDQREIDGVAGRMPRPRGDIAESEQRALRQLREVPLGRRFPA